MNNPLAAIPAKYRVYVYMTLALIGLALGATQVGFAAVGAANPEWLVAALAVVPFVMSGLGFTAATHVPAAPDVQATPPQEPLTGVRGYDDSA